LQEQPGYLPRVSWSNSLIIYLLMKRVRFP
jgi:hypothetical protein